MKKNLLLTIFLLIVSFGFCGEEKNCKPCVKQKTGCEQTCEWIMEDSPPCDCGYNCTARTNAKCGWNFYLDASFIYWQAREDLDFNRTFSQNNFIPSITEQENLWEFDYKPGFKVGFGGYSNHDNWDLQFKYTGLKTENKMHIALDVSNVDNSNISNFLINFWDFGGPQSLVPPSIQSGAISAEEAVWKLHTNLMDGDVGRSFFVGTKLVFKPFLGLRGGWIDQKYRSTITIYDQANVSGGVTAKGFGRFKTDSWLIGPRLGVNTNWLIGKGFRFFGDSAFGLYFQKFSYSGKLFPVFSSSTTNTGILKTSLSKRESHITPNIDCALGLGWGSYFNDKRWHLDFSASYDFLFFWSQNVLEKGAATVYIYQPLRPSGNLMFHGLTITAKVDF